MSNRLAIMQEGKIVEIGESEKVYKSPQNDYSKRLINSIPEFI
jgi:peptide/nickel transport system ATP-binding protein